MKRFPYWKDLGAAYSLATLWFIVPWKEHLFSGNNDYLTFEPRSPLEHLAIFMNVVLLMLGLYCIIRFSSAEGGWIRRISQIALIVLGAMAFGPLSYELFKWLMPEADRMTTYPLPVLVLVLCSAFAIRSGKFMLSSVAGNMRLIALLLLPFCLLIVLRSLGTQFFGDYRYLMPQSIEAPVSAAQPPGHRKRIVWLIFDELGGGTLFAARLNRTDISEFDRLMSESFVALNAYSPSRDTLVSIPALLTGRPLRKAKPLSSRDLLLFPEDDSGPFSFRESGTVFSELKAAGARTAVVGWYHPYPRVLEGQVSYCVWRPRVDRRCSDTSRLERCLGGIWVRSLGTVPFGGQLMPYALRGLDTEYVPEELETQIERVDLLTEKANELVANRDFDFLFFHLSTPHAPFMTRPGSKREGSYFTSLEVANDVLKQLRQTLERAGEWDETVLILSSDHPWRAKRREIKQFQFLPEPQREEVVEDTRIPFIVKLPGHRTRVDYQPEFNTVLTRFLIEDIYQGKIESPEELLTWFENFPRSHGGLPISKTPGTAVEP